MGIFVRYTVYAFLLLMIQRIRAQDYSHYYEWPECAGVAYDPALSAYANEYSYGPASSSYINSPSTQQLYYSQDALIGGLQYPPEWKKTPLPKTPSSKSGWPSSFENSHQSHIPENHSSNYHANTENNKANTNSKNNDYKEMPLEELINTFLQWYQPSQDTGQTKHTVNPSSQHDPLLHNYMLNGGNHISQPETANGVNVPQASHNYKRNTGTSGYPEVSSPQQQQAYSPPHQQPQNLNQQSQNSHQQPPNSHQQSQNLYQQSQISHQLPQNVQQQSQNPHHFGQTSTINSETSSSAKSFDLQHLINNFMEFVNGQQTDQISTKHAIESNYHSTLPNQSQLTTHQPYQQTQPKPAHKRTTSSQNPVSYTNVGHNIQQQQYETGNPVNNKQMVPNYPSFSDPNLGAYDYDSHATHDALTQTEAHKSVASTDYPQTNYNQISNSVSQSNIQQYQSEQALQYSSAISPAQVLSNTDIANNKYNSPISHHQSPTNQYHKPQTYNTQLDPLLSNDKNVPATKPYHKTNTNARPPRNNILPNQNIQQYPQNLMPPQPTGTSHDYNPHHLPSWSQQPTQQAAASSLINNKPITKPKQSPQDDLMKNIDIINEFLGKRFNTNKPKQNTQQVASNTNINKQQNPIRNPQQEMLFQQMVDDNFPQILESLSKTPAPVTKTSRNQNPKNVKRNLLQQVISDNLPGIIDSLNKNHPQFQNKNGEIDVRQLQSLLQQG